MKIRLLDGTGTIDLRYLYNDFDRHGNMRIYVRRRDGAPKIRLREEVGSEKFLAEYRAAIKGEKLPAIEPPGSRAAIRPGSLRDLVARYVESGTFKTELGEATRKRRRDVLEAICSEKINGVETGPLPYALMEPKHVLEIRDVKSHVPGSGNDRLKALRKMFEWAMDPTVGLATANPATQVKYFKSSSEGFHSWEVAEIEQFQGRHPVGTKARLALDLLLYTGVRRSDVIKLGRQMETNGVLRFTETKGSARKKKHRALPILAPLRTSIEATNLGHLTYLTTETGKPYSHGGFGNWFKRQCRLAGLEHCSAHGLRKAGATIASNNGATVHELKAIYGWTTLKEAARYTERADMERLAQGGMHKLLPEQKEVKTSPPSVTVHRGGELSRSKALK